MTTDILKEAIQEMKAAVSSTSHPFRYPSVATCKEPQKIKLRKMVLRKYKEDDKLIFFTDSRSLKIKQIKINPHASALFYDPVNKIQLVVCGKFSIDQTSSAFLKFENSIEGNARHDYNTKIAPGKAIRNPFNIERGENLNFAVLEFEIESIEYLKLRKSPGHTRALFIKKDGNWEKTFLVP